ncbi:MAG TPA: cytochrome P450 [Gemmataceae bacterium]|nr:cytochrome P450 [Gemmataceae bacterium]
MGLLAQLMAFRRPRPAGVDITSPAFKADPYPFYARLREESPVSPVTLPNGLTAWLVTRYDDVAAVLRDERFAKHPANALTPEQIARMPRIPRAFQPLDRNMLSADGPDHNRLRDLVQRAFTPGLVEGMRRRVQQIADHYLDALAGRPRFDLIRDYALPIPTTVIAEMLGVPVEDRHRFHRWSRSILLSSSSRWGLWKTLPALWSFLRYIRRLIDARRAALRDDLVSALIRAEEAGDRLSGEELMAMIFLLLVAGHETTVNLIGNGVLALLEHPEQLSRLRADPGLIRPAVEELLRFASPVETTSRRFAREDVTVAGVTIPRGALMFAVIASANRDRRQFPDPDRLDLSREPNRHLAFGLGPHYCIGAPLARLEGQIAVQTLLRRAPGLRLDVPPQRLRWRGGVIVRGLEALPVAVDAWA